VDDQLALDLEHWEGPLDLLLALARAQKVDLRQISIGQLVEQYLAVVEHAASLKLEVAADWLVMAAWLAYLKSALLLPREPDAQPDPDELALRLQLRLERLQAMRDAGARLMARDRLGRDVFPRGAPEGLRVVRQTQPSATLYDLIAAYGRVSARTRPALHVVADREVMTLEDALARLRALLGEHSEWRGIEAYLPAAASPRLRRSALASSFLAVLELARQGRAELRQAAPFAPLLLRGAA
jgi:segregation and condensation protein A